MTLALRMRLLAATLATIATPAGAQQILGVRDARAVRADSVFRAFDRTDSPGCALGVYRKGGILYARGYGMANLELGVANTPRTVFDVGSVSKQFTTMSILLLAKDGKLSIDDPVRKHVPELPSYADRITVRQLMSHTSGIRDHFGLMEVAGFSFEGTADSVDFLRLITRSAAPNFEPGTRYLYSNSGFVLLSTIVYRVSGQPLGRFATQRILEPLGMHDTRVQDDHAMVIPNRATGYAPRGDRFAVRMSQFDDMAGAAGVHTSIEDFGRWLRNFDQATVGGPDVIDRLLTPSRFRNDSIAATGPDAAYALGLTVGTYRGLRMASHGGVWAGYRANFMRFPDQDLAVATFCNLTTSGPDSLTQQVAAIYLEKEMRPDSAAVWRRALAELPAAPFPADARRAVVGVWRNVDRGETRRVEIAGDTVVLVGPGRQVLTPLGGLRFRAAPATEIAFEGGGAGAPSRLVVRTAGSATTYERAPAVSLTAAQLAEYAGSYRSAEVDVTQEIRVEDGRLVVMRAGRRLGPLDPTYRDGFMRGSAVMDFTRDAKGRVSGFVLEAGRVRHLRFTRTR